MKQNFAYCVHCSAQHKMEDPKKGKTLKNGAVIVKGTCSSCGGKVTRIVSADSPMLK